jgi:hypothetical protein
MPKTRRNRTSGLTKEQRKRLEKLNKVGNMLDKIGFMTKKGTRKVMKKGKKIIFEYKKSF